MPCVAYAERSIQLETLTHSASGTGENFKGMGVVVATFHDPH